MRDGHSTQVEGKTPDDELMEGTTIWHVDYSVSITTLDLEFYRDPSECFCFCGRIRRNKTIYGFVYFVLQELIAI